MSFRDHPTAGGRFLHSLTLVPLLVAFVLLTHTFADEPAGSSTSPSPYRIVGYVFGGTDISKIGAQKLSHINYAFGLVSTNGEIYFSNPQRSAERLAQLRGLKSKNPNLKIVLSVGGWGADNFSDAAFTEESRAKFARSSAQTVETHSLDGIDLDWEYPGQAGPGIKFRPEDKQNFTLLLQAVRHALDELSDKRKRTGPDRFTLSIASAAGSYFRHTEMDKLHPHLDWINIMTYDFCGEGSKTTGHHTCLYPTAGARDPHHSLDAYVKEHLAAGIPRDKLVIGAAFYAKSWSGVDKEESKIERSFQKYAGGFPFSKLQRDYLNTNGFVRLWDAQAKAPYLWNADTATFVTYDDPESVREKANYVKAEKLGGIMYWEHGEDAGEVLLDVMREALRTAP